MYCDQYNIYTQHTLLLAALRFFLKTWTLSSSAASMQCVEALSRNGWQDPSTLRLCPFKWSKIQRVIVSDDMGRERARESRRSLLSERVECSTIVVRLYRYGTVTVQSPPLLSEKSQ
jgi:hypothetical protein